MKHFIYIDQYNNKRGSQNKTVRVYRLKNNKPHYLGSFDYSTASTPGSDTEVLQFLSELGELPKKYGNSVYYNEIAHKNICTITEL